ncbi:hypothetical protein ACFQ34_09670 [Pseudonocardia benzenivorans]|uniref:Secreted protein with PEP-CTERM sorting signal n=1 Tax=Pseudonocardia benzenivorans TaxID=228005 RepID=A0ABW3VFQ4_9PSEU
MFHSLIWASLWPEFVLTLILAAMLGWALAELSCRRRWRRAAALRGIVLRGRRHGARRPNDGAR